MPCLDSRGPEPLQGRVAWSERYEVGPAATLHPRQILLNNIGTKGTELISRIRDDLALVISLFPGAHVIFSNICERRVWMRGTYDAPGRLNKTRRYINKA